MPLRNRVDPFGDIHAVPQRGTFTGNRGVIHDPVSRTLLSRRWTTKAWLICECTFQGRRRDVMGSNGRSGGAGWTELFFLDEVTALAAGHRPCFHCRRERAVSFIEACADLLEQGPRAPQADRILHRQRLASGGQGKPIDHAALAKLPDGVMVARGRQAFALRGGRLLEWRFSGYGKGRAMNTSSDDPLIVLTPELAVTALRNGYRPAWHESAATDE